MLSILDLCSGIGGFALGLTHADLIDKYYIKQFVDINPECQKVLRKHYPDIPISCDIKSLTVKQNEYDIICGSIPCQPHSLAAGNLRKGGLDERDLGKDFIRLVGECQPQGFVLEEVPGFRNSDQGKYFKNFIKELGELGYILHWGHYSAAQVGAVHYRRRFWVIGLSVKMDSCLTVLKEEEEEEVFNYSFLMGRNKQPKTNSDWLKISIEHKTKLEHSLLTHDDLDNALTYCCDTNRKDPRRKVYLSLLGNAIVPHCSAFIWRLFDNLLSSGSYFTQYLSDNATNKVIHLSQYLDVKQLLPPEGLLLHGRVYHMKQWGQPLKGIENKIMLPTPLACCSKFPGARTHKKGQNKHLPHALVPWRLPKEQGEDWLNPLFVQYMMGFPSGWLVG